MLPIRTGCSGWLLWLVLCWLAACCHAEVLPLADRQATLAAGRYFRLLEDPGGRLALADIRRAATDNTRWRQQTADGINLGYSRSAFWLHAGIRNDATLQRDWMFGVRYPLLDYLDVYFVTPDGRVQHHASGDRRPFAQRSADDRNFHFALHLPPGERVDVYLRVAGQGSLQLPIEVTTPDNRALRSQREQLMLGLYCGALLSMLAYNLLLYLSLRDRSYLYYVGYIGAFGLAQASLNGLAFQYLWPTLPGWGNLATPLFMGLAGTLLALFSRDFLMLRQHWPAADRLMRALQWLFILVMPLALLLDYSIPVKLATAGSLAAPPILLLITAILLRRGLQQARYFLAAFGGLLLGITLAALHMFGLAPASLLTEYGIQIGSALEFTLLSFALAHRMKLNKDENQRIQHEIAASLEQKVQDRTRELDTTLRELAQANVRLTELSLTDALTQVRNRKHFDEALHTEWRRSCRWRHEVGLLMIDIDFFKRVNDNHGHLAGDAALRQVAAVLRDTLKRPHDLAARYGGEEFAVILPQTDRAGILHVAETIRRAVEQLDFQFDGLPIPLTVSIGAAQLVASQELQEQTLVACADQALYRAKHQGRNRTVIGEMPAAADAPNC